MEKTMRQMLEAVGKPSLLLRFRSWACICMHHRQIPEALRLRIRPWQLFGYSCWCDKADQG
jgi:hypothetical protein